ncbi:MAG: hypothetical protein IJD68_00795 [Ruminococcus sp.]|nr:hypothetical protein [Ruminococcus sp.]
MLTALHIENRKYNNALSRILGYIVGNSLKTEIKSINKHQIKFIKYTCKNNKINWQKIDKVVLAQRNRLLCSETLELPKKYGYKRFEDDEYKHRLCTNMAVSLLCSIKNADFKVGLVDKEAIHTQLVKYLLKYIDNLTVVTDKVDDYLLVAETELLETGVPIRLTKSEKAVHDCDFIIAPDGMNFSIGLKESALVLSCKKPSADLECTVVYDYTVDLGEAIEGLCPHWLDKTYFASALYTQLRIYQLGSLVPSLCVCNKGVHTILSLKAILEKQNDKT